MDLKCAEARIIKVINMIRKIHKKRPSMQVIFEFINSEDGCATQVMGIEVFKNALESLEQHKKVEHRGKDGLDSYFPCVETTEFTTEQPSMTTEDCNIFHHPTSAVDGVAEAIQIEDAENIINKRFEAILSERINSLIKKELELFKPVLRRRLHED